jgi:hypothetical protein
MVRRGRTKAVGTAGKITHPYLLGTQIRNLGEPELLHLFRQLGGFEKAQVWFAASCGLGHHHGQKPLALLVE